MATAHDITSLGFSDAAKRCSDIITLAALTGNHRKWVAIRLSDGGHDGVFYDTRRDAISHQLHERLCCYVFIPRDGMSPKNAETFLALNRKLYDAGMRLSDPDHEPHVPHSTFDALKPHLWMPGRPL